MTPRLPRPLLASFFSSIFSHVVNMLMVPWKTRPIPGLSFRLTFQTLKHLNWGASGETPLASKPFIKRALGKSPRSWRHIRSWLWQHDQLFRMRDSSTSKTNKITSYHFNVKTHINKSYQIRFSTTREKRTPHPAVSSHFAAVQWPEFCRVPGHFKKWERSNFPESGVRSVKRLMNIYMRSEYLYRSE